MTNFDVLCQIEAGQEFDWAFITGTQMHALVDDALVRYEGAGVVLTALGVRSLQKRREYRALHAAEKLNQENDQ